MKYLSELNKHEVKLLREGGYLKDGHYCLSELSPGNYSIDFETSDICSDAYVYLVSHNKEIRKNEQRRLNLIINKSASGSVGYKLSIPKPWAAALGVDLNNRTVVASFDGDKIIISGIKK